MLLRVFIVRTSFIDQAKGAKHVRWAWCLCAYINAVVGLKSFADILLGCYMTREIMSKK